jgi:site-specific DNA recombinase
MKKAVIYARVSTSRQAQDELPIEGQVDRCRRKADELDATVDQVFVDEGLSGATDQRPAFQNCIDYCELTTPDYLITWSTSRFSRSQYHAAVYKHRLDHAGVEIVYISLPIDRGTDSGFVLESVLSLFDEMTSRQIASDTKRSMMRLAGQGYFTGGTPPYGFHPVPVPGEKKRRRLQPVPEEAETAQRMFDMRLAGIGAKLIADELNNQGITNRGRRWVQGSVLYVLRSEALIGKTVFNRKDRKTGRKRPEDQWIRVESHQPVIEREKWEAVQAMIDQDAPERGSGSPHSTYLFTGLARCSCGSRMQIKTATGRSKRYSYYECLAANRGRECPGRRIPARELDDWLLEIVTRRVFNRENLLEVYRELHSAAGDWAKDRAKRMQTAQRTLAGVERKQSKLFDILELHGRDAPDLGDLTQRMRTNKREIERIEQKIAEIDAEQPPELRITEEELDQLREFLADRLRDRSDVKRSRAFFAEFIDRIDVLDDEVQIQYRPDRLIGADTVRSAKNWLPGRRLLRTAVEGLPGRWCRAA